jgi:hypothetical protein
MAAKKLATSLMDKGFVRKVRAKPGMPAWRRNEDGRTYALVITKSGRAAIRVADEGGTHMDAVKDVGLPGPRTHKGKRPVAVRRQFVTPGLSDRDLVTLHVARIVLRPQHIEVTILVPDPASRASLLSPRAIRTSTSSPATHFSPPSRDDVGWTISSRGA